MSPSREHNPDSRRITTWLATYSNTSNSPALVLGGIENSLCSPSGRDDLVRDNVRRLLGGSDGGRD